VTASAKTVPSDAAREIARRRTFAIISHPDAGKTTLTEKLLLYGGAIHLAGSVTARKNQNATASDWMAMEKERGISVSSTVLQFDYEGSRVNLLDTPGHHAVAVGSRFSFSSTSWTGPPGLRSNCSTSWSVCSGFLRFRSTGRSGTVRDSGASTTGKRRR